MNAILAKGRSENDSVIPGVETICIRSDVSGFIYFKARDVDSIRRACEGVLDVHSERIQKLSQRDGCRITSKKRLGRVQLQEGHWVMVLNGLYARDFAYVAESLDDGMVALWVVPRYRIPGAPTTDRAENEASALSGRPNPMLFDGPSTLAKLRAARVSDEHLPIQEDIHTWSIGTKKFVHGFEQLVVPPYEYVLSYATPTLAELDIFADCKTNQVVRSDALRFMRRYQHSLWVDDRVLVKTGEFLGCIGTVKSSEGHCVTVLITEGPDSLCRHYVDFDSYSLEKIFQKGDWVEVMRGKYTHQEAWVVDVEDDARGPQHLKLLEGYGYDKPVSYETFVKFNIIIYVFFTD